MTKHEIIDETVAFYGADPVGRRAKQGASCKYLTDDGRMCAFSRCMIDPTLAVPYEGNRCTGVVFKGKVPHYDTLEERKRIYEAPITVGVLKPQYDGHSLEFWLHVQELHDNNINWDDKGLSNIGAHYVKKLKQQWSD